MSFLGGKKFWFWLRSIAVVVLIAFTVNTIAWADGSGGLLNSISKEIKSIPSATPSNTTSFSDYLKDLSQIKIPSEIGTVKSSFQGSQDRLVIHIQDAHVNEEAQRNIARLVEYSHKTLKNNLVAVEGAEGYLETALLGSFDDPNARKLISDYYLREGILSGPEYLAITELPELKIYGVEEKALYEENRAAFLDALKFKDRSVNSLSEIPDRRHL